MIFRKRAHVILKNGCAEVGAHGPDELFKMMICCMIALERVGVDMSKVKEALNETQIPIENCD